MHEGIGRIVPAGRARTRNVVVPAGVASDSSFPFQDGEKVLIVIEGDHLIVKKITDSTRSD